MESRVNLQKTAQESRQEELLRQYTLLSASDQRRSKHFLAHLTEEERLALERNAHYDGDAWRHLTTDAAVGLSEWTLKAGELADVWEYGESLLGYYNVLVGRARRFSPATAHQHAFVELCYVVRGVCHDVIKGHNLTLIPGDLLLLQPKTVHQLGIPKECVVYQAAVRTHTFYNVCQELLTSCQELPLCCCVLEQEENAFLLFRTGVDPELLRLFEQMFTECACPHKYFNMILQGQLASLLAFLLNEQEPDPICISADTDTTLTEAHLRTYICTHLSEVTLPSAAAYFGFSSSYFCTLVREKIGQNFSALLREEKLHTAARMLTQTNQTIQKICEETGYESVSQFSGTFKRNYGVSPGEYRRRSSK